LNSHLVEIFEDKALTDKIKKRLPYFYQLAELESSRAGKIGMEVGSLREKVLSPYSSINLGGVMSKQVFPLQNQRLM